MWKRTGQRCTAVWPHACSGAHASPGPRHSRGSKPPGIPSSLLRGSPECSKVTWSLSAHRGSWFFVSLTLFLQLSPCSYSARFAFCSALLSCSASAMWTDPRPHHKGTDKCLIKIQVLSQRETVLRSPQSHGRAVPMTFCVPPLHSSDGSLSPTPGRQMNGGGVSPL